MPNSDYYSDGDPAASPPGGGTVTATEDQEKSQDSEAQTATVPKEFFGSAPPEVGDRCEVEVMQIADQEVVVKYVEHDEEEEAAGEAPPERPMRPVPGPGGGDMGGMYD